MTPKVVFHIKYQHIFFSPIMAYVLRLVIRQCYSTLRYNSVGMSSIPPPGLYFPMYDWTNFGSELSANCNLQHNVSHISPSRLPYQLPLVSPYRLAFCHVTLQKLSHFGPLSTLRLHINCRGQLFFALCLQHIWQLEWAVMIYSRSNLTAN